MTDADRILALLLAALPGVAVGCAPAESTGSKDTGAAATTDKEGKPVEEPTTAVAPEPDPPPVATETGDAGADETTGGVAPAIEVPEGADYCFLSAKAVEMQDGEDASGKCPKRLKDGEVRDAVESFHRRTGGPWDVTIELRDALSSGTTDDGDVCCYEHVFKRRPGTRPMKGRLLAGELGEPLLPALESTTAASSGAAAWIEDARMELASVASFARGALELMRLGAPSELVADYLSAAQDEARHARLCLDAARSLGVEATLGPVSAAAARALELPALAVTVLEEAALGETVAALQATRAAARATEPVLAKLQATIAADETRHAALAWRTLAWALDEGGAPVHAALRRVPLALQAPDIATAGEHDHGRLGLDALRRAQADGLAIARRLLDTLLRGARSPVAG